GALLCLSLYLQQSRHESVLATGLLLLPMSVVVGVGSLASGRLTARLGPRPPMIAGLALGAAGMALLATAATATSLALVVAGSVWPWPGQRSAIAERSSASGGSGGRPPGTSAV